MVILVMYTCWKHLVHIVEIEKNIGHKRLTIKNKYKHYVSNFLNLSNSNIIIISL